MKYKRSVEGLGKHDDLYQLLSYTVATDLPEGVLIYAAGEGEPGVHHVRHLGKCLKVLALDLSGSPREVLGHIASVAAQIRDGVSTASAAGVAVQ